MVEFSTIPDADDFPPETHGARVLAVAAVYDGPADEGEDCAIQGLYDGLFPKGRDRNGAFCYVQLDITMDIARCHRDVQPGVQRKWLVWLLFCTHMYPK